MKGKKRFVTLLMIAVMVLGMATTSFATETISEVSVSVSYGETDDSGVFYEPVVSTNATNYYVADCEFEHSDSGSAKTGTLEITFKPASGYAFANSGWTKSKVTIEGEAKYSKILSSSSSKLVIRLKYDLDGELSEPDNVEWQGFWATWDEVDGATYYEVKFRGSYYKVYDNNEYNLSSYVRMEKENTFEVRARNSSMKSDWVESDSIYPDSYSENDYNGNHYYDNNYCNNTGDNYYKPGYGPNGYNGGSNNNTTYNKSGWQQDSRGIWYYYSNGNMVKNNWIQDTKSKYWYFMNADGSMAVGWKYLNSKWYYLSTSTPYGHMVANSEEYINGVWYKFDSSGALKTDVYVRGRYIDSNGYVH